MRINCLPVMDCFYTEISGKPERLLFEKKDALKDAAILPHNCTILSLLHVSTNYQ